MVELHGLFGEPCIKGIGGSLQRPLRDSIFLGQFATSCEKKKGFYVNVLKQNLRFMT